MTCEIEPTNPEREKEMGRVALWLEAEDLRWLSRHCCCPSDATEEQRQRCARLRFRASAAMHKAGLSGDRESGEAETPR